MARSLIAFGIVAALLSAGCVPVTRPVGDIDKAEPDKALVGKWTVTKSNGLAAEIKIEALTFDTPDVKGNPKGLKRAIANQGANNDFWFYVTTVGKNTYANCLLADDNNPPRFDKQGEFEKWNGETNRRCFVFQYKRDGDTLTLDCGNLDKFTTLMKDEKITDDGSKHVPFFNTPSGWFAKHFDKNKPDTIFDGTNTMTLKREKK